MNADSTKPKSPARGEIAGEVWGGLAAMLVALPSAIAFGVAIHGKLGPDYVAQGAVAGMIGAVALGLLAPIFGGAPRLITVPCAPAAAVMGTLALDLASGKSASGALSPAQVTLFLTLVALMSGGLQFLYGSIGSGRLIKYIPFPVVSGYLSGVGLKIFLDQVPKLFGFSVSKEAGLWKGLSVGLTSPDLWQWQAIVVGTVTMMGMILGPKITKAVPAAILGLFGGIVTYLGLGLVDRTLLDLHNKLLIGPLATGGGHCGAE